MVKAVKMKAPSRRTVILLLTFGTIIGLFVRYRMLFYMGVSDMDSYYQWGSRALEVSLGKSYHGIYFPFQYQIFELCAWIVPRLGAPFFVVFKSANLIFDLGSFFLLVALLNRRQASPLYALLYWLHPWFLTVFSLGYVDFQFTFFVLLSVYLLRGDTWKDYLLAGIPLGLAFVMKPQAQILVVATFFYGLLHFVRIRNTAPFGMLLAPSVLFLGYELSITYSLPRPRYVGAEVLPMSYLNVTNILPALTAQMPNVWAPVAYLIKHPGKSIISVSDQIQLLPHLPAKYVAIAIVLGLVGFQVVRVELISNSTVCDKFITIFAFASVVVPLFMTSAHENHLFLGSVFLVLLSAGRLPLAAKLALQVLLLVQFLNIYRLYGAYPVWLVEALRRTVSDEVTVAYSLISLACFGVLAKLLWHPRSSLEV